MTLGLWVQVCEYFRFRTRGMCGIRAHAYTHAHAHAHVHSQSPHTPTHSDKHTPAGPPSTMGRLQRRAHHSRVARAVKRVVNAPLSHRNKCQKRPRNRPMQAEKRTRKSLLRRKRNLGHRQNLHFRWHLYCRLPWRAQKEKRNLGHRNNVLLNGHI